MFPRACIMTAGLQGLPLDARAPAAMVGFLLHQHGLGQASMTLTYGR